MKKYDVAVVGGGFAGVAAALSAAREGAKVILIEKSNCLGGAAVNSLVNPFMCWWTSIDGQRVDLAAGIFKEITDRLKARHGMMAGAFDEELLKFILNEMMEEAGVDLLFHANIFKAEKVNGKITSVTMASRCGEFTVEADFFVDATGDALLTHLASCPTVLGRESDNLCQPMTLCFRLGNCDTRRFFESRERWAPEHAKWLAEGKFMNPRENVLVFKNVVPNVLHFNTTRVIKKNPTSPIEFTEAEILARKQVYEIYDFLKEHADGLENSCLLMTASEIGVRESRMIVGEYTLTETDCKDCVKFEDAIAACNYEIDIHNPEGTGTTLYYFKEGEYYTIPYRSLIPKEATNLLVAGRCVSADHTAQASLRIMPVVCCIGEAAGTAIALAQKNNIDVRNVDIKELQTTLKNNNAYVGI